jgi:hypothetical protein
MPSQILKVRASVRFLTSQEGGKTTSVTGLYRPVHNFGGAGNLELWFGQIPLLPGDTINPGDTRELVIEFPLDLSLLPELRPGRAWRIQEGPNHVANATVIEVLR